MPFKTLHQVIKENKIIYIRYFQFVISYKHWSTRTQHTQNTTLYIYIFKWCTHMQFKNIKSIIFYISREGKNGNKFKKGKNRCGILHPC